jgi:hypothetical protein
VGCVRSAWDAFLAPLSQSEREDPLAAWYSRLMSAEADVRDKAVRNSTTVFRVWVKHRLLVCSVVSVHQIQQSLSVTTGD